MKYNKLNNARKYLVILSVFLFAASCSKQQPVVVAPTPTPTPTGSLNQGMNKYVSPEKYGFSIEYSESFALSTDASQVKGLSYIPICDDNMVACAYLKKADFKGTNFDGAGVSVNIYQNLNSEATCYDFSAATNEAQVPKGGEIIIPINGVNFHSAVGGGAGAGHFDKLQVYRNFHNGMCYEIAQDLAQTNIGNYEPGTIKPFDEKAVWEQLQNVVESFMFTSVSALSPSIGSKVTITGTSVCLPHKNVKPGQPQTMECAIGLKDDKTGKYYGLKNPKNDFFDTNIKIKVEGVLTDDSKSNYDTVGSIEVSSLVKI